MISILRRAFSVFLLIACLCIPGFAANKFWVGGTGNLDGSDTTHISNTSGGAGGAVYPGVNDVLIFDASSGGGTVTFTAPAAFSGWTAGAFTGTVNTNGQTGTFTGACSITGTGTRTITLGASAMSCGTWDATVTTNLTFNANTSVITVTTGISSSILAGGGLTYNTLVWTASTNTGQVTPPVLSGANTFANLTFSNTTAYVHRALAADQTVTGTFTATGVNNNAGRMLVFSNVVGTARTITAAVVSITNVDFQDITGAGAGTWSGTSIGDCWGNTGITPTAAADVYWVSSTSASWLSGGKWFTASGGAVASHMPLCQDTARIDANSGVGDAVFTGGTGGDIRMSNVVIDNAPAGFAIVVTADLDFYGSWTANVNRWTPGSNDDVSFKGRGTHTIQSSGATWTTQAQGDVFFTAPGGTYTLADAFVSSGVINFRNGTFVDAGFAVTGSAIESDNANVRTVTKSGTWTLNGDGSDEPAMFRFTTTTNFTWTDSGTTLITGGGTIARSILGSNLLFNHISISAGTGSFTLTNFNCNNLDFTGFTGTLATNAFTLRGSLTYGAGMTVTDSANLITMAATSGTKTITSNGVTGRPITFDGVGGTWQLGDAFTVTATRTLTLTNGTLNLNGQNASVGLFASSNANARVLTLGNGTLTLTGAGTVFDVSTATNLTVTATTGTIKLTNASATAKTFSGAGLVYGNIWLTGAGTGTFDFVGDNTFADFKVDTPPHTVRFTAGSTTTVTSFTASGTAANPITIGSITAAGHTLAYAGTDIVSRVYLSISRSTATPANTWFTDASTDGGNNSDWIFRRPSRGNFFY